VLHLPEMNMRLFALSGRPLKPYWNWSEHLRDKA
jgi:hypothetical protein